MNSSHKDLSFKKITVKKKNVGQHQLKKLTHKANFQDRSSFDADGLRLLASGKGEPYRSTSTV